VDTSTTEWGLVTGHALYLLNSACDPWPSGLTLDMFSFAAVQATKEDDCLRVEWNTDDDAMRARFEDYGFVDTQSRTPHRTAKPLPASGPRRNGDELFGDAMSTTSRRCNETFTNGT